LARYKLPPIECGKYGLKEIHPLVLPEWSNENITVTKCKSDILPSIRRMSIYKYNAGEERTFDLMIAYKGATDNQKSW
jgi:hypothetical protein